MSDLEIYVHIPFCVRKCAYCDFLSGPADEDAKARYLTGLFDEFRFYAEKLKSADYSVRGLIRQSNVRLICTTDDPVDSLIWHEKIRDDASFDVQVLPAWRPDRAMNIEKPDFADYIGSLFEDTVR